MKKLLSTIILSLFIIIGSAQNKTYLDVNYMEVIGTSELKITPDIINLHVTITEKDNNGAKSITQQELIMKDSLRNLGIDVSKDITVIGLSSKAKYRKYKDDKVLMIREYNILLHDAKTTTQVMDKLEQVGISSFYISNYDHSKIVELRKQARVDAIKAAKNKADYLTAAIGQTVGKAINIEEINQNDNRKKYAYNSNVNYEMNASFEAPSSGLETESENDIQFTKIIIKSSIKVIFIIN